MAVVVRITCAPFLKTVTCSIFEAVLMGSVFEKREVERKSSKRVNVLISHLFKVKKYILRMLVMGRLHKFLEGNFSN